MNSLLVKITISVCALRYLLLVFVPSFGVNLSEFLMNFRSRVNVVLALRCKTYDQRVSK